MKRICLTKDADYDNSESKYHEHKILFYFDVDDVYTAINAHWLKINPDHIGMIGYFGNSLQSLINGVLYDCHKGKLDLTIGGIDNKKRFIATGDNRMGNKEYTYFLPADKVKRSKKEARVIKKLADLRELLGVDELVGTVIHLKEMDSDQKSIHLVKSMITSTSESTIDNACSFVIDGCGYKINADGTPDSILETFMKYTLIRNKDGNYVPWTLAEVQ